MEIVYYMYVIKDTLRNILSVFINKNQSKDGDVFSSQGGQFNKMSKLTIINRVLSQLFTQVTQIFKTRILF